MKTKKSKARIALLMVGAFVAVAALEVVAGAHNYDNTATISIRYAKKKDAFVGRVRSGRKMCKRRRQVAIYKKKKGRDKFVGNDRSGNGGYYVVPFGQPKGRYYAVASGRQIKKYRHNHRCRRTSSKTIKVN